MKFFIKFNLFNCDFEMIHILEGIFEHIFEGIIFFYINVKTCFIAILFVKKRIKKERFSTCFVVVYLIGIKQSLF